MLCFGNERVFKRQMGVEVVYLVCFRCTPFSSYSMLQRHFFSAATASNCSLSIIAVRCLDIIYLSKEHSHGWILFADLLKILKLPFLHKKQWWFFLVSCYSSAAYENSFWVITRTFRLLYHNISLPTVDTTGLRYWYNIWVFYFAFFRSWYAELKEIPAIIGDWKRINAGFRFYQSNIQFASRRTADRIGH